MPHLLPKDLVELPYVDRLPNPDERPDQRRIEWIKNGECFGGAAHAADNSGELNRSGVQVQKNAVTLSTNDKIIDESIREIIERVNSHDDALGSIGDDNLATKLEALEEKVDPLDSMIVENTQKIFLIGEAIVDVTTRLGKKSPLDIHDRTLFEDTFWVKKEIGNWAGKDVNDNDNPLIVSPTGLKARIISQGLGISSNERRIGKLESDWIQSDVGTLTSDIQDIRGELGRVSDAPALGVYRWIKNSNDQHDQYDRDIDILKNIVGGGGTGDTLDERITKNTTKIEENVLNIADHENRISNIVSQIGDATVQGSMQYNITQSEMKLNVLEGIVGMSEDAGLQKGVQDIRNEIGTDAQAGTIKNRMVTTESKVLDAQRDVATLTTKVGDNTAGSETGIYKRLMTTETSLYEPNTGLVDIVGAMKTGKVDEAPKDGNVYGRKDGAWDRIAGGGAGGIQDAPNDGKDYVRKSENWSVLNVDGVVLPEGQKIQIMKGVDKLDLIALFDTNMVIGSQSSEITLSGKVKSFKADTTFAITSSDATNANIIASSAGILEIGDTSTETILKSGNKSVKVETANGKKEVIHEGNIADHLPLRIHGGYYVADNDTKTTSTTTPVKIEVDNTKVSALALNTADVMMKEGKLVFTPKTIGSIVNVVVDLRIVTTGTDAVKFDIIDSSGAVVLSRSIETDEWSASKKSVLRMQGPVQIGVADEELTIMVSSTSGTDQVTVSDGMFYVFSI